jgi:hypothetical protein
MNDKRLSTFQYQEKVEIAQSLIDEVLNMKDVYIKGPEGVTDKCFKSKTCK